MENLTKRMARLRIVGSPPNTIMENVIKKRKRNEERRTSRKGLKNITGARIRKRFTGITIPIPLVPYPNTIYRRAPMRFRRPPNRQNMEIQKMMKEMKSNYEKRKKNRKNMENVIRRIGLHNAALANTYQKLQNSIRNSAKPNNVKKYKLNPLGFRMMYQLSNKNRQNKYSKAVKNIYGPLMYNNFNNNNSPRSYERLYNYLLKVENFKQKYNTWKTANNNNKIKFEKPLLISLNKLQPIKSKTIQLINEDLKTLYKSKIPENSRVRQIIPINRISLHTQHINKPTVSRFIKFASRKK